MSDYSSQLKEHTANKWLHELKFIAPKKKLYSDKYSIAAGSHWNLRNSNLYISFTV